MTENKTEYKYLEFVNFKDLTKWDYSSIMWNKKYREFFGENINNVSIDILRNQLKELIYLTQSYWSKWLRNQKNKLYNDPHRYIDQIPWMSRERLEEYILYFLGLDMEQFFNYTLENILQEEKKLEEYKSKINEYLNKKRNN